MAGFEISSKGNFSLTSAGLHPVGINQIRTLSKYLSACQASFNNCQRCLKLIITGFQVWTGFNVPYTGLMSSTSAWKEPKSLSQTIRIWP